MEGGRNLAVWVEWEGGEGEVEFSGWKEVEI